MVKWTLFLKRNKEGIIIGGLVGFILGKFFLTSDFDLTIISESQGIVDSFRRADTSIVEFAKTKLVIGTTVIGAVIGMLIDNYYKPRR